MFKNKLIGIAAALILVSSAAAVPAVEVWDDSIDKVQGAADIRRLTVDSDGKDITVELVLVAEPVDPVKYRIHFDYENDLAVDGNLTCITTSDDTSMRRGTRQTGPGSWGAPVNNGDGTTSLVLTVPYNDLIRDDGTVVAAGQTVYIWADTHFKGILDRAPDTFVDAADICPEPQSINEVLRATLN